MVLQFLDTIKCDYNWCLPIFQVQEPFSYIERFNFAMNQYLQALSGIVPIFNYMVSDANTCTTHK